MTAAGFPTETTASQCPRKKPRPALPGDLEAWSSRRPLARPPVWSPGTASSKQQAGRAAAPEQQNQGMFRQLLRLFRKESVDQGETTPGQREAEPLSSETGRRKSFWGRLGFGRKASSQNVISKQEECLKELEELKFEIQKCQFERDELYQILDLYIYDEWDHRSEILQQKLEHDTDQDKISLGEKSFGRRTKCAQQIHHYCVSSVMSIAIVDCIFLLSFNFFGLNRLYFHLSSLQQV
nr:uncharacterized protein LOC685668 isoform X2 [Rattus norvegicus]